MDNIDKFRELQNRMAHSARTNEDRVHVTFQDNGWAVRKQRNLMATRVLPNKAEALFFAKGMLENNQTSGVVVHRIDGSVQRTIGSGF